MNRSEYFQELWERLLLVACGFGMGMSFCLWTTANKPIEPPQAEVREHEPQEPSEK